ncbi:MAG: hypothetical protein RQ885_07385 [Desulfurococcales archaeon]|nr:hypothetical protein [Desulfurococcales archaeon]
MPLGSTAFPRRLPGHIARKMEWEEAPDGHRVLNPVDQETRQHQKQKYQR